MTAANAEDTNALARPAPRRRKMDRFSSSSADDGADDDDDDDDEIVLPIEKDGSPFDLTSC